MMKNRNRNRRKVLITCLFFGLFCVADLSATTCQAESGSFSGSLSANGTKESLSLGENRTAALFRLSGHVNLTNHKGISADYWSECIGLADSDTGSDVRCVWSSQDGHEIFISLEGSPFAQGSEVIGKIIGGTGNMSGISGTLSFHWASMLTQTDNRKVAIGGYAKDLKGIYTVP